MKSCLGLTVGLLVLLGTMPIGAQAPGDASFVVGLKGLSGAADVDTVKGLLSGIKGVKSVTVDLQKSEATIGAAADAGLDRVAVAKALENSGFAVTAFAAAPMTETETVWVLMLNGGGG